ncbi:MAG: sigma-70 family RNA polymerase sigma factor, partial [Verrucomicrobiota bacterium]
MDRGTLSTEEVWGMLSQRLKRFLLPRVGDEQAAEDLLQETFLRIHQKIDTIHDEERITAWVFQIARNLLTDYYRANSRQPPTVELNEELDSGSGAGENLNEMVMGWIPSVIRQLPETYREAVALYELEGMPQ